jgi:Ca-activated chloride channel family protein
MPFLKAPKVLLVIGLLIMAALVSACAPSAEQLTQSGNDAFAKQAYQEALVAYQQAQLESPQLAEPYYNAASTLYRQGQYQKALGELQKALQYGDAKQLAHNSYFNIGNSAYNLEDWTAAVDAYREALVRNPDDQDAKHNLELALQQLQKEQEQQENQDQQQDQQENQDQQQDQQENQDQQQDQQENQDQQQDQQENQDQQQDQQENQDQQQDQQENQDQQQDQQENQDQQQDQQENQDQQQDQQENQDQQQDQQENQDQQPNQQPGQGDQPPSDAPYQSSFVPSAGQRLTEEQARQLLAAIAQNSETLQERLGQYLMVRGRPPLQDW